jgi:hypothetical protein
MKTRLATALSGIIRIGGGLAILVAFPAEGVHSGVPTLKTPGPYPYETPGQVPAPPPVWIRRPCRRLLLFPTLNHLHLLCGSGSRFTNRRGSTSALGESRA